MVVVMVMMTVLVWRWWCDDSGDGNVMVVVTVV
jgi:hypothetical protein